MSHMNFNASLIFSMKVLYNLIIFKRFYLFIFREKGREGEREGEKHQCVVATCAPPTGYLAHKPCVLTGNQTGDPLVHSIH